jgi:hypothetical protein
VPTFLKDSRVQGLLVSAAFVVAVLLLTPVRAALGWDESVYASQISNHVALSWAAPRGRGMPLLAAPVTLWSDSAGVLRIYLTVLAGAALYVMMWLWGKVQPPKVAILGGVVFGSLWITQNQGSQNLGNLWLAFAVACAAALFFWYPARPRFPVLAGLAVAVALACLFHGPTDGAALAVGLALCLPLVSRFRWRLVAAVAAGLVIGLGEWSAEAFMYFGNPLHRLALARKEGSGFGFFLSRYLRVLSDNVLGYAWWALLLLLLVVGAFLAIRAMFLRSRHQARPVVGAVIVGAIMLLEYLLFLPLPQPRYFLPAFALWSFAVAYGLARLVPRDTVAVLATVVAVAVFGYAAQAATFSRITRGERTTGAQVTTAASDLRQAGVRAPCVLVGAGATDAMPVAYYAGCTGIHKALPAVAKRQPRTRTAVFLVRGRKKKVRALPKSQWRAYRLPHTALTAYIRKTPRD